MISYLGLVVKGCLRKNRMVIRIVFFLLIFNMLLGWFANNWKEEFLTVTWLPSILLMNSLKKNGKVQVRSEQLPANQNFAYATLLCDDLMTDAIKVLIYSLKKTTNYPFLLLVLPGVKERTELIKLGAEIHEITMLEYPFKVTAEKVAINKMCRYSKLHIWRFIEYKKIIFIDVDCLVIQSLDQAFRHSEFSAVRDAGDTFNTGLFVLEPSIETWNNMRQSYPNAPSYNQGDQGFINWFFRNSIKTALPVRYNTVCKHKGYATWSIMKRQAKMFHYTSETKPWNFFHSPHKYWRQNFDPTIYYLWSKTFRLLSQQLGIDVHDPKRSMWLNSKRVGEVCDRFFPTIENTDIEDLRITNKVSIIFTRWRSFRSLGNAINHYRIILEPIVYKIYINWNPSLGNPPIEISRLRFLKSSPQIEIIHHRYESVNNIWNPIPGLATKAVFLADDEHLPDLEKMEIALETWKANQNSLIGFFARYHTRQKLSDPSLAVDPYELQETFPSTITTSVSGIDAAGGEGEKVIVATPHQPTLSTPSSMPILDDNFLWVYNLTSARRPRPYSLLSSQMLMLNSDYLFIYTCLLPERIHRHVDEQSEDSSDLAMNLLASGMTGSRPILVKSDFSDPESGRFAGESWALTRGQILKDLVKIFTGTFKDPLQYNTVSVTQFNKIPFKKRSVKQWNKYS